MRHPLRPSSTVVVLVALGGAVAACGHRGDPLPPLRHTPPTPSEFRLAQRGSSLELAVTAPGASVDGIAYESVEVEFLFVEGTKDLEKAGVRRLVTAQPRQRVAFSLPLPAPGTAARAAARGVYGKQKGARTLIMGLVAQAELPPPRELEATLTAEGVRLAWAGDAPAPVDATIPPPRIPALLTGRPPAAGTAAPSGVATDTAADAPKVEKPERHGGFLVYRRAGSATYAAPLTPRLLEKHNLNDTSAPEGEKVCYVVRAAASLEPLVESGPSNEACLGVRDIKPPGVPTGLAVLPREGGLELVWTPSPEEDLAGYRVYREAAGEPRVRVAELEAGRAGWTDAAAKPGVAYRYSVTAFDRAGNESAPTAALEASLP